MSSFKPLKTKTADDGKEIRICIDGHRAWFVERPEDREAHTHPMGAFITEEAAITWADHRHPGGEWTDFEG